MIYPPYDSLTPGKLICPPNTYNKNGFCFYSQNANSLYRDIPIEPYTKQPIQWYHNPNLEVVFPKLVFSLTHVDDQGVTNYFAPSGYQLDTLNPQYSNIDPNVFSDYFSNLVFPKLNDNPANLDTISYGLHSDPIIYPSPNPSITFDPRLTYPSKQSPATEQCPKFITVTYRASYGIWYGGFSGAFMGVIEVIAHAGLPRSLFVDYYSFDKIPDFFVKPFQPTDEIGGLWLVENGNSLCFYANGAFAFSAKAYNAVHEEVWTDPFTLNGNAMSDGDWDCSIPLSAFDDLPPNLGLLALGQECEILSIEAHSPRPAIGIDVMTFINGPALCGDYHSPTCWARHQIKLQIPIYSVNIQVNETNNALIINNNITLDSYKNRFQSFFRFCDNEFLNSSQRIDYEINNYWISSLAFNLPTDPNWPEKIYNDNYLFWVSAQEANNAVSDQHIATLYMPLISNLNLPNDNIPIVGGVLTPQPNVSLITSHSFRYLYNASELIDCPDWPLQSGLTVPYDAQSLPGNNQLIAGQPCGGA